METNNNKPMTATEIINAAETWSKNDLENHSSAVILRDETSGNVAIHYAGMPNEIAKCVVALMAEDSDIAVAIFASVTVTAYKNFPEEIVTGVNEASSKIAYLRRSGATDADIEKIMLGK
nr:MAG TPA: hypothetical protein [Caudoviricetes sp.]